MKKPSEGDILFSLAAIWFICWVGAIIYMVLRQHYVTPGPWGSFKDPVYWYINGAIASTYIPLCIWHSRYKKRRRFN